MAKKAEQPKVDTNFENDFWNAASELRSAVTEQRYKDSVVSLLFLKHLPERYEIHKE